MSNVMLNRICNDENDSMLRVKLRCKHGDLLSMQTSWSEHNPTRRFWSCLRYREDVCNFFRWRDREDVDIQSNYVIPRLAKRIKELEEALTCYESRVESNQVVMRDKKKSKCCNLKLIVLIVIVCFVFLSLTKNVKDGSCRCVQPKFP
ncbi:hypothetical protein R3W88_000614 [Solanum pinnatisectum]|uniref:GRF-type domain-containing protein n=1 Tax=Solanum pinnatisectum TaxID=50273 RepID=A0AAV9MJK5_9SOLN|nr:hypothetical protein R3W88_000614 [Solanum pinnatisectum]